MIDRDSGSARHHRWLMVFTLMYCFCTPSTACSHASNLGGHGYVPVLANTDCRPRHVYRLGTY